MSTLIPVIMAGGAGRRLWPLSREAHPKQFYPLLDKGQSLLQQTALRAMQLAASDHIITVTSQETLELTRTQLAQLDEALATHVIAEPAAKNTAPAIFTAALYAEKYFEKPLLWVAPSDHHIPDSAPLVENIRRAARVAEGDCVVTLGMKPEIISNHFGYMVAAPELLAEGAYRVQHFLEKPEVEVAASLAQNPLCFINSGMFVMRSEMVLNEAARYAPELLRHAEHAMLDGKTQDGAFLPAATHYEQMMALPIDKAVMEKSDMLMVIPATFEWADIGSWDGLWQRLDKDAKGNALIGHAEMTDSHSNLIMTGGKRTICLGVENLVIIDTKDTLLIAHKDALGNLKQVMEEAASRKAEPTH